MKESPRFKSFERVAPFLLVTFLVTAAPAAMPSTYALLRSLFDPGIHAQANAEEGYSVAVNDSIVVVGAPADDQGGPDSGIVNVYDAITGARLKLLVNPSPASGDRFGHSVSLSATRVVVGAPWDDTGASNAGSAYIYDLTNATPTVPVATLTNPSPASVKKFGASVAISGALVVIGTLGDSTVDDHDGRAYVYDLANATPAMPIATLDNPAPRLGDHFGISVAISGTRVVVGDPTDGTAANHSGHAYLYDLASATPAVPAAVLTNSSPVTNDRFGYSVAIDGLRVAVGAYDDSIGTTNAGSVYVYDLASGNPIAPLAILNSPYPAFADNFGISLAISGTRVVVGAHLDDTGATNAGSAYVYDLTSATPTVPLVTFHNPHPSFADNFGVSVAIFGTRVVVGAHLDDTGATNAGSVYVYDLTCATSTVPLAKLNNSSRLGSFNFGSALAISGTYVVVGAPYDYVGPDEAGGVYVYDLATPNALVATIPNPSPAHGDWFGLSVAISGTRVVIGAPYDDTGGTDAGGAYVYDLASPTPTVPVATITNPAPANPVNFGHGVAVSDRWLVVGAFPNVTAVAPPGAYVYDLASTTPTMPFLTLTNYYMADVDGGSAWAISGSRLVVGARTFSIGDETLIGSAFVYDFSSATPTEPVTTLTNPAPARHDQFGWSVAISGTLIVIGAKWDDAGTIPDAGTANVYDLSSATPARPILTLTNPIPAAYSEFGSSVGISGRWVVVGARYDDSEETDAGRAYVYDLANANPALPVATLTNPTPGVLDYFGWSVAVDGTTIVVGAPIDNTNVGDRGAAYIFGMPPRLKFNFASAGFATITSTPFGSPNFQLQYTDNLSSGNWINAPVCAVCPLTVPTTNLSRFYRLFSP